MTEPSTPHASGLEPDPLAEAQNPLQLYVGGGVGLAVAAGAIVAGLSFGGWPAVGCYVIAGVAGLYGGYVLALGVGWRVGSRAVTRVTTRSLHGEAESLGQRVLELRFKADLDESHADVNEVDRIMDEISAELGEAGECPQADSTGDRHRLFIRAADVQTGVNAVRLVASRRPLPADSYVWIPDGTDPRMGRRLTL